MPLLLLLLLQAAPTPQAPATGTTAAWTLRMKVAAVDMDRGVVTWEKPELAGLPVDSVRMVEGSLLMEAARPGLLIVFDPVTGGVVFDSRKPSLTQVVTRRVLP